MLSKQYMSASYIESSLYRIQLTPDNSNLPPTRSNFCFPSDHFYVIRKKKRCTEIPNIAFNWKQPCQFFVRLYFLSLQFKFIVHSPVSYQALLLLKFLVHNINLYFLLPLKWSMHDTCVPSPSICLFPVICFDLTITRTFFGFHRRFELSGVDCSFKWWKSIIGSNTDWNKTKKIHF